MPASSLSLLTMVRLTSYERARLEEILAAMLPAATAGLPAFEAGDRAGFYRAIEETTGPTFLPGLRMMIATYSFLPLGYRGYRRPFFSLDAHRRRAFVADLALQPGYVARQLTATMKVLAAFAYFEDPSARARFDLSPMVES